MVSNMEIWCECFGKNRADITPMDSTRIRQVLIKFGWKRHRNKRRLPLYGSQWVYVPEPDPQPDPPQILDHPWNTPVPTSPAVEHPNVELAHP